MRNQIPSDWCTEECSSSLGPEDSIRTHFREYSWFLDRAEKAWQERNVQAACSYASMAALIATHRHCGFFASPRLERMLISIGRAIPDKGTYKRELRAPPKSQRILHVCTELGPIGGLASMLTRLIKQDTTRQHSVIVTRPGSDVPASIAEATAGSGGTIRLLTKRPSNYPARALELRQVAREYDLIVLHIYSEDVLPLLAFARLTDVPPVLYLNHADHLFWLGSSVSDVVINLRESGQNLSIYRRGIASERNVLVPTLIKKPDRKRAVEDAKRELGLAPDSILLVSVARGIKYRTHNKITFADTHVPALLDNPKAHLIVVGAGEPEDWERARIATGGRITSIAAVRDPLIYFEAADIYVDSYPFVSSTSMMEAAGYALPLLSRFYAPKEAEIVGIDHPGLKAATLLASNDDQYDEILRELILDPNLRRQRGKAAELAVTEFHQLPGWMHFWNAAIDKATALAPLDGSQVFVTERDEAPWFGEPDIRIHEMFGWNTPTAHWLHGHLRYLPIVDRLSRWNELRQAGVFFSWRNALANLLPDKILVRSGR